MVETKHSPADIRFASIERYSSVVRTVEIVSNAWSFLILRECFFGVRRFDHFQRILQIPRTTLYSRLKRFLDLGILKQQRISAHGRRLEYRLTDKGRDLYSTMIALMIFGDHWLANNDSRPLTLFHHKCARPCSPIVVCSHCHQQFKPHEVRYRDGPGAEKKSNQKPFQTRTRRSSDVSVFERIRPCSVARTLQIIGDRWSFLIIREFFYGVRRFDEFQTRLGIATNILSVRLKRLVEQGIAQREPYQNAPTRYEYRLTEKGLNLYNIMLVMMAWGDKWIFDNKPPLLLTHTTCKHDFHAIIICDKCNKILDPRQMGYRANYRLPDELEEIFKN